MSLLLKALKQAEAAHATKPGTNKSDTGVSGPADLELEPVSATGSGQAPEWVEPPGLLFGNDGLTHEPPRRAPSFRWPHLSLVPLTALLAALIALGYGVYLYFELQPPVAVNVSPPAETTTPSIAPAIQTGPTPITAVAVAPAPTLPARAELPLPHKPASPPVKAVEPVVSSTAVKTQVSPPVATGPQREASPPRPVTPPLAAAPQFQPDIQTAWLSQAYAAYQRGALAEAQRLYTQAAARGRSVDALLGLAAIASVQNREAEAQRLYREVLDLDPRNAAAQGALLDLLGNTDNLATESRLKTLIERDPSAQLYQTLGNLYADQGRWNDAQAAYFEAFRSAPHNADYAFNLAVSLDQLRQFTAAQAYYGKALALKGMHRFDRAQAEARVQQLKATQR